MASRLGPDVNHSSYDQVVQRFQMLAHRGRLRLLDELRRGEACVCHLQTALQRPQAYVSQQLRLLRETGVIESRRDGLYVFYRLSDPLVQRVLDETLGPADDRVPVPGCVCPHCSPEIESADPGTPAAEDM